MKIFSTYSVKIKEYNHIFKAIVAIYRDTVDFLIDACLNVWDNISTITLAENVGVICTKPSPL